MSCERNYNLFIRSLTGDAISEAEKEEVERHIAECPECREIYDNLQSDHHDLNALAASYQDSIASVEKLVEEILFSENRIGEKQNSRNALSVPWFRIAAMILVILGVTLVLNLLYIPQITFTEWDTVSAMVEQAKSVTWDQTLQADVFGGKEVLLRTSVSEDYGFRIETTAGGQHINTTYYSSDDKELISLMHPTKNYIVMPISMEAAFANNDTQDLRQVLQEFLRGNYTELGTTTIEGVEVAGIQADNAELFGGGNYIDRAELWVNTKTKLPVRLIYHLSAAETGMVTMVMDNIKWNQNVDASYYEPVIPDIYTLKMRFHAIIGDERSAIESLKVYADLVGFYPDVLNSIAPREKAENSLGNNSSDEEIKEIYRIFNAIVFQQNLLSGRQEPKYFGANVKPGDSDKILWEWKLENGDRRVVYGDLRVETVQ